MCSLPVKKLMLMPRRIQSQHLHKKHHNIHELTSKHSANTTDILAKARLRVSLNNQATVLRTTIQCRTAVNKTWQGKCHSFSRTKDRNDTSQRSLTKDGSALSVEGMKCKTWGLAYYAKSARNLRWIDAYR